MAPGPNATVILYRGADMFRLNARNVFLTYPKCPIAPATLGEFLATIRPTFYVHVTRESHRDGHFHLHALVQWVDKFNLRNERKFDIQGYHPNIQPARDVESVEDYISKHVSESSDRSTVEWTSGTLKTSAKNDKWKHVAEASTPTEVLERALEASPRDFVLQYDRICEFARLKQRQRVRYIPNPAERFRLPPGLAEYMITEFTKPVGLCPWILFERHIFSSPTHRTVLEPSFCWDHHVSARRDGLEASDIIYTGAACPICRSLTRRQPISSQMTSTSTTSRTKSNGSAHSTSSRPQTSTIEK